MFTKSEYDELSGDHKKIVETMHALFGGQTSLEQFLETKLMRLMNSKSWSRPSDAEIVRKLHALYETAVKLNHYDDVIIIVEPSRTEFSTVAVHRGMDTLLQTIHVQEDLLTFGTLQDMALYVDFLVKSMAEAYDVKK